MRYSLEPTYNRRYVKGYGFLSFARKFEGKYGKTLMNTATKTRINAAKNKNKYGKNLMNTAKKKQGTNFTKTAGRKIVQKLLEKLLEI